MDFRKFTDKNGQIDPKKVQAYIHTPKTARKEVETNKKQVPARVEAERQGRAGRHITPKTTQDIYADMMSGPSSYKGFTTNPLAHQSFSEPTGYELNPALAATLGSSAAKFQEIYGNDRFEYVPTPRLRQESKQMAAHINRMASAQQRPVRLVYESWMVTNYEHNSKELVMEVGKDLRFGF